MLEKFVVVEGHPNYLISNYGRVLSLYSKRFLKPSINGGYVTYVLDKKHISAHRLVAKAFIPNPHNYSCVNHKNEIKTCNEYWNLEWCTSKYNNEYNNLKVRRGKAISKAIQAKGGQHNKGKKMSIEQRQKISLAMRGREFKGNQYTKMPK